MPLAAPPNKTSCVPPLSIVAPVATPCTCCEPPSPIVARIGEPVDDLSTAVERGAARDAVDELITAAIDCGRVRRP